MSVFDVFCALMTMSMADRADAATWGSRQPPPHTARRKDDKVIMAEHIPSVDKTVQADVRSSLSLTRRDVLTRAAAGVAGAALASAPLSQVFAAAPAVHVAKKTLTVGAKDFSENQIVGWMYIFLLQKAGISVNGQLKKNLTTAEATPALQNGSLDIFPEYTGTGVLNVLKESVPQNPASFYKAVKAGYQSKLKLTWLDVYPMNDTQGFATTQAYAKKTGITSIPAMVAKGHAVRLIVATEYLSRADGLPGLKKVYGNFDPHLVKINGAGSLRYTALLRGEGDVVEAFTTDAAIAGNHLVVLADPKNYGPPDNLAPVVRDDALASYPKLAATLNVLAPKMTSATITELNYQADILGKDPQDVARTYLKKVGLI